MESLIDTLQTLGANPDTHLRVLKSILTLFALWILGGLASRLVLSHVEDRGILYRSRKGIRTLFFVMAFILVGRIWYVGIHSVVTFLGLLSAGLAVALKDLLMDCAAFFYLLWRKPFRVGERIQIEGLTGDVINLGLFQFSLLELSSKTGGLSSGRIVHVPNHKVFSEPIYNYEQSFSFIWDEIDVVVTFESDWRRAKALLLEIGKGHSHKYDEAALLRFQKASENYMLPEIVLDAFVFVSVVDHGVKLSVRFVCEPRARRKTEEKVWESILDSFAGEAGIDLAYPTERHYDNSKEGKTPHRFSMPTV